ncbi:antibiotic biosynthesis monooxygenase [Phenylobacterium sp.]|uniref:antibiotic biosynthesis monooxygenase family protein n=1 Tax=Phenylobacterium sp. TaxID=1871053 RepID=UPI0028A23B51|nr:antibiotic biosynthesis monooxygenase [Phenylobacterium sp.]
MTGRPTMARVVRTPAPPYYSVTTTTELAPGYDGAAHRRLGRQLYERASALGGFLGLEAFFDEGASIAVSYWESLEAIERWRNDPPHGAAKRLAKSEWFGPTITRIARVEADYGFNLDGSAAG